MHKYEFVVVVRIFENHMAFHDFECKAINLSSAVKLMEKEFDGLPILDYSVSEVY